MSKRNTILDLLKEKKLNEFFLNPKIYSSIELPPYVKFEQLLQQVSKELNGESIPFDELKLAKEQEDVNYIIFGNKDGRYAWRKLELINPYIYISLVNTIIKEDAWSLILERFKQVNITDKITCASIPVLKESNSQQKATQINEWIDEVERKSIELSLNFEYILHGDISNCYGTIYTHSISWAIHTKKIAKKEKNNKDLLGNKIDNHIRAMSFGQTNGIPQGSLIMDLIAEIVLAYTDEILFKKISDNKLCKYHIIRYRDDYRIFVKNPKDGDTILHLLSETLAELGMSLNTAKIKKSEDIIINSIKPDKLFSNNRPLPDVFEKNKLISELLYIYEINNKFPNSGSLLKRINNIYDNCDKNKLKIHHKEVVGILVNIAINSPKTYPVVAALISKSISMLDEKSKKDVLTNLLDKIKLLPNSSLLEVWIQRITIKEQISHEYINKLSKKVAEENVDLFNIEWSTNSNMKKIFSTIEIIDRKEIEDMADIIQPEEFNIFKKYI